MTRAKLDAFLAAAADLGVVAVNYLAPDGERPRPIVSIDAGSRAAAVNVAHALGMPVPCEVNWNGARWLSSSVMEPALYIDVRSRPEEQAVDATTAIDVAPAGGVL